MATPSREVAQTLTSATSKRGLNREERAALLRVRTWPECPEGNLRELKWDSNPNCGLAGRGRGAGGNYPTKSPNLRHCQPAHRTKDWVNTRGELAGCGLAHPLPEAGKQTGCSQSRKGANGPRDSILHQTASRLPVPNQDFLGFRTVDICWEGCSQRSAPQKRHIAHLRGCTHCHPGNQAAGTREVIRCTAPGESALTKHLVAWAARTLEGHKTQAQPSLCLCRIPENLNLSGLDLGI